MTRGILLGLAGLIALSTAVVVAHTHDHETSSDEPDNQNDNIVQGATLPVFKVRQAPDTSVLPRNVGTVEY